jgi:CRP-like cAMP-binding protein
MHESCFDYLKQYISDPISDEDKALIKNAFSPLKLRKKQHLLQAGELCNSIAFITKGAMRQYTVDDKGNEQIASLGIENWWICDRESFVLSTPSSYSIDAWEDSEMLILSRADNLELMNLKPFAEMVNKLNYNNNAANQKRIAASISLTAEQRYSDFMESHPELARRFPQHVIASYLGITKDTLSRIKRNILQR